MKPTVVLLHPTIAGSTLWRPIVDGLVDREIEVILPPSTAMTQISDGFDTYWQMYVANVVSALDQTDDDGNITFMSCGDASLLAPIAATMTTKRVNGYISLSKSALHPHAMPVPYKGSYEPRSRLDMLRNWSPSFTAVLLEYLSSGGHFPPDEPAYFDERISDPVVWAIVRAETKSYPLRFFQENIPVYPASYSTNQCYIQMGRLHGQPSSVSRWQTQLIDQLMGSFADIQSYDERLLGAINDQVADAIRNFRSFV